MGNIVRTLSGLSQLLGDYINTRKAVPKEIYRDVGQAIDEVPRKSFFQMYSKPAMSERAAEEAYGLRFKPEDRRSSTAWRALGIDTGKLSDRDYNKLMERHGYAIDPNPKDNAYKRRAYVNPTSHVNMATINREAYPEYFDFLKSLDRKRLYDIDTSELQAGAGEGARVYPGIFDLMSGIKKEINVPISLTDVNQLRRSLNMAGAVKRDPRVENLILPHPTQFDLSGLTPQEYMELDRVSKMGALHTNAALKGFSNALGLRPFRSSDSDINTALAILDNIDPTNNYDEIDSILSLVPQTKGILANSGLSANVLRGMGNVNSILKGQSLDSKAYHGISRKRGGLASLS